MDARMQRYGRESAAPPFSPKSRLVHIALEDPPASPATILDRAPIHGMEDDSLGLHYSSSAHDDRACAPNNLLHPAEVRSPRPQTPGRPSLSQCYSCAMPCWDEPHMHGAAPPGESAHWFLDVHDGVRRRVAYLFCWRCVDVLVRQLQRPPHPGCGHLPALAMPACAEECQRMFCARCRVDIGARLGALHG